MKVLAQIKFTPADPVVWLATPDALPLGNIGRLEDGRFVVRLSNGCQLAKPDRVSPLVHTGTRDKVPCEDLGPAILVPDREGIIHARPQNPNYRVKRKPVPAGKVPIGSVLRHEDADSALIVTRRREADDLVEAVSWSANGTGRETSIDFGVEVLVIGTAEFVYLDI